MYLTKVRMLVNVGWKKKKKLVREFFILSLLMPLIARVRDSG